MKKLPHQNQNTINGQSALFDNTVAIFRSDRNTFIVTFSFTPKDDNSVPVLTIFDRFLMLAWVFYTLIFDGISVCVLLLAFSKCFPVKHNGGACCIEFCGNGGGWSCKGRQE